MPETQGYVTNYADAETGSTFQNAYLNISRILYQPNGVIHIDYDIYASQALFENGNQFVLQGYSALNTQDPNWATYFDADAVTGNQDTLLAKSLEYLQTLYPAV